MFIFNNDFAPSFLVLVFVFDFLFFSGVQGLATKGGGRKKQRRNLGKQNTEKLRNVLGMQVEQLKAVKYELKQEYAADPEIVR